MENGDNVTAIKNVWHNLVKAGAKGQIVKVSEFGYNVFFPLSIHFDYQAQIFFCTPDMIELTK